MHALLPQVQDELREAVAVSGAGRSRSRSRSRSCHGSSSELMVIESECLEGWVVLA